MLAFTEVNLIYRGLTDDELGNPKEILEVKKVKARLDSTFSDYYYNERGRSQQMSMNLCVNAYLTTPYTSKVNNANMTLYQVQFNNVKYAVRNILNDKRNRMKKILDCEQMMY